MRVPLLRSLTTVHEKDELDTPNVVHEVDEGENTLSEEEPGNSKDVDSYKERLSYKKMQITIEVDSAS